MSVPVNNSITADYLLGGEIRFFDACSWGGLASGLVIGLIAQQALGYAGCRFSQLPCGARVLARSPEAFSNLWISALCKGYTRFLEPLVGGALGGSVGILWSGYHSFGKGVSIAQKWDIGKYLYTHSNDARPISEVLGEHPNKNVSRYVAAR